MYKTAGDKTAYLERVASHSTKEHRSGRIDMIPLWAKEPEEYYNQMRNRWSSLSDQLQSCEAELQSIKLKLKTTLPIKEYQFFIERQKAERTKYNTLVQSVAEYRMIARAAAEHSVGAVFMELAKKQLDKKVFDDLMQSTKEVLGRPLEPIHIGGSEKTQEQRFNKRRKEKRQRKRHKFFEQRYGEKFIVERSIYAQEHGSTIGFDKAAKLNREKAGD